MINPLWSVLLAAVCLFLVYLGERSRKKAIMREIRDRFGSKVKAADRLSAIIAADRASVPCGRWVEDEGSRAVVSLYRVFEGRDPSGWKRRYRWSERR